MKRFFPVLLLALATVISPTLGGAADACCPINTSKSASLEGTAAPAMTLTDLQGQDVTLADLREQVVVVSFWSEGWLSNESPIEELQSLQSEYGDRIRVVAVAMNDRAESQAKQWLSDQGAACEILRGGEAVAEQCSLDSLPMTLVIDAEGTVTKQFTNSVSAEQISSEVGRLLRG